MNAHSAEDRGASVVLITGASSGIGRACADLLRDRGLNVYGTSRKHMKGEGWKALQLDVTDRGCIRRAVGQVLEAEGRLDVLVNSAGIAVVGPMEDLSDVECRKEMETNFFGVVCMCQEVLPIFRRQGRGKIVTIGSLAGQIGLPFMSLYSASKHALEGFTEALRIEVQPFGIKVALVEPGDVDTPLVDHHIYPEQATSAAYAAAYLHVKEQYEDNVRQGAPARQVAERVWKIIQTRNPSVRYSTGKTFDRIGARLKRVLPARFFEWALRKTYRLDHFQR